MTEKEELKKKKRRFISFSHILAIAFLGVVVFVGYQQVLGEGELDVWMGVDGDIRVEGAISVDEALYFCGQGTVSHGGYDYSTVEIGDQCWFAEDLRYDNGCSGNTWNDSAPFNACDDAVDGSTDYGNLLYQWGAAMDGSTTPGAQGLCPDGWHIPTDDEIKELEGYVDSTYGVGNAEWDGTSYRGDDAGDQLKDPDEAWCNGTPCGESGWDALPGGLRFTSGSLSNVGSSGYWWSSSVDGGYAWARLLVSSSSGVNRRSYSQAYGRSVRCLRD